MIMAYGTMDVKGMISCDYGKMTTNHRIVEKDGGGGTNATLLATIRCTARCI